MYETTGNLTASFVGIDSYRPTHFAITTPADFYDQQIQFTECLPLSMNDLTFMREPALGPCKNNQMSASSNFTAGSKIKLSRNHVPGDTIAERQQFRSDNGMPRRGRTVGSKNKNTHVNAQDYAYSVCDTPRPADQAKERSIRRPGRPAGVKNRPKDVIQRERAEKAQKKLEKQQRKALANPPHERVLVVAAPIHQQASDVIDAALVGNGGADHNPIQPGRYPAEIAGAEGRNMPAEEPFASAQRQIRDVIVNNRVQHAFLQTELTPSNAMQTKNFTNSGIDMNSGLDNALPLQEPDYSMGPLLFTTPFVDRDTFLADQ